MSDVVIELSIAETNELRAKLGLKPLNISGSQPQNQHHHIQQHDQHQQSIDPPLSPCKESKCNGVATTRQEEHLELSVEETNKLRLSLGMKPLNTNTNNNNNNNNKDINNHGKDIHIHAPPENEGTLQNLHDRLQNEKLKRQVQQGIQSIFGTNTLATPSTHNNTQDTVHSWALKMKARDIKNNDANANANKKNKKIKNSQKSLEDPSSSLEDGYDPLDTLHVGHDPADFEAGTTTILTLSDTSLLAKAEGSQKVIGINEDTDGGAKLENVLMAQNQNQRDRLREKRQVEMAMGRGGGYVGFDDDEFEELGGIQAPVWMQRGAGQSIQDDPSLPRKVRGFVLGNANLSDAVGRVANQSDLFAYEDGKAISLDHADANAMASDFMTVEEYAASLGKRKEISFKKNKKKKEKKSKRKVQVDDYDDASNKNDNLDQQIPNRSIVEELEKTAVIFSNKRKRRENNDDELHSSSNVDTSVLEDTAKRRARYDEIMEKGNQLSELVFQPHVMDSKKTETAFEEEEPDDNILNEALANARRLRKLKELSKPQGADAVVQAIKDSNAKVNHAEESKEVTGGITFAHDQTREFTIALRAREEADQRQKAKLEHKKGKLAILGTQTKRPHNTNEMDFADKTAEEDIDELAKQIKDDEEVKAEMGVGGTATVSTVGRGMASVLAMLRQTGELNGRNAGREELRGRAKDERNYEDYTPLDLKQVVRIGTGATDKDRELASREIKLDYRDEHGRLLTRKEAFRNLCYQFHGHGSSAKNEERRLRQIAREQSEARVASSQASGAGSLGALKAAQKVTGKAFVIRKL